MSKNIGKVVQVIGTVVDVEFQQENLPEIYNALELEVNGEKLVLEVEQHVGNNWARCLALGATEVYLGELKSKIQVLQFLFQLVKLPLEEYLMY